MFAYTIVQWCLFFYIYCFVGWCIESTIVSWDKKRLVNRGFLNGPWLPLYGTGALVVLICSLPLRQSILLVYFAGMIGATVLEYFTGWAMEIILKVRYWDYSNDPLNINGHICLKSSLFWGGLSVLVTFVVHPLVEDIVLGINSNIIFILFVILTCLFVWDVYVSARNVLGIAAFLENVKIIREEIEQLKDELADISSERIEELEVMMKNKRKELDVKIAVLTKEKDELFEQLTNRGKDLIKNYPSATAKRFQTGLDELKEKLKIVKKSEESKEN